MTKRDPVIDIRTEDVMPLAKAAGFVGRLKGKKVHTSTLYRWVKVGRKGCRLEGISVGGTMCTSVEALQRYFEELTRMELQEVPRMVTATRQRQMEEVERKLDEWLGPDSRPVGRATRRP